MHMRCWAPKCADGGPVSRTCAPGLFPRSDGKVAWTDLLRKRKVARSEKLFDMGDHNAYRSFMTIQDMIRDRGLKQGWIAEQIGIGDAHFSEMARGLKRVPLEIVEPLARLLGVEIADVVRAALPKSSPAVGTEPPEVA